MKITLLILFTFQSALALDTYTLRQAESKLDTRYQYDNNLIKLALDKTIIEYGHYKIKYSPVMNFNRATREASQNSLKNFIFKLSFEDKHNALGIVPIKFPVDLGIVGNRVCFINPKQKKNVTKDIMLNQLKSLINGQGLGWSDVHILRDNGFPVIEIPQYESLFKMVSKGRIDLFCRGINEIKSEYSLRHVKNKNLAIDENILIQYDLPRFFYTHKSNIKALKRIQKGLEIAFKDGSLHKLWLAEYKESLDFVNMKKRKKFKLKNNFTDKIKFNYKKYYFTDY